MASRIPPSGPVSSHPRPAAFPQSNEWTAPCRVKRKTDLKVTTLSNSLRLPKIDLSASHKKLWTVHLGYFFSIAKTPGIFAKLLSAYQPLYGDKKRYLQYLHNLLLDLSLLEFQLLGTNLSDLFPKSLCRSLEIAQTIGNLQNTQEKMLQIIPNQDHTHYLIALAGQPHLLIAHLSINYLEFLFGGILASERLKGSFGENSIALYQWIPPAEPETLKRQFLERMDQYLRALSVKEFNEFQREIPTAWQFVYAHFPLPKS